MAEGGPRKRARTESVPDEGLGGLYDFLPPPDPEKDAAAKDAAEKVILVRRPLPPEDKTRVIFLDVDGVLLGTGSVEMICIDGVQLPKHQTMKASDFSSAAFGALRTIIEKTGAGIVLSSEWRRTETLRSSIQGVLREHDLPLFRGHTPIFNPKPELQKADPILAWCERRAREIGQWLKDHREVTSWVALDDLDFSLADSVRVAGTPWIKHRSVHTNDRICFTDADAEEAIRIILNPPPDPKVRITRGALTEVSSSGLLCSTEDSAPERIRLG